MIEAAAQYKEALVAISGVSAVLWTGGLIIFQIRNDQHRRRTSQRASEKRDADLLKGGLACIAFGMLAPLFALFVDEQPMRYGALALSLVYSVLASGTGGIKGAFFRYGNWADATMVGVSFLFPTAAMFVVYIAPKVLTVLWCSAVLDFVGYFSLSSIVYGLGRAPSAHKRPPLHKKDD